MSRSGERLARNASTAPASARSRVYEYVLEQIVRGDFPAGEFIEEERICKATGVSRTPVREAFHMLQAERFLELLPRRGARVRQVTAQEMLDTYEARRLIEGFAVERICHEKRPLPEHMDELAERMRALGSDDTVQHIDLDRQFHRTLVAGSRNVILLESYDNLRSRQIHVAFAALRVDPGRIDTILDEHEALVRALTRHDADAAVSLLHIHLQPIRHVVAALPAS